VSDSTPLLPPVENEKCPSYLRRLLQMKDLPPLVHLVVTHDEIKEMVRIFDHRDRQVLALKTVASKAAGITPEAVAGIHRLQKELTRGALRNVKIPRFVFDRLAEALEDLHSLQNIDVAVAGKEPSDG